MKELSTGNSMVRGALAFAAVSVGAFAVWAFGGIWLHRAVGEGGLYAACAAVFVLLSGFFLAPLVRGPRPMLRVYKAFMPAFLLYAVVWSACWFKLGFGNGEWLASLLGCAIFGWVLGKMLGAKKAYLITIVILFVCHSAGYFAGGWFYGMLPAKASSLGLDKKTTGLLAKLIWGLCFGLGFGAGIGFAFSKFQTPSGPAK
jgi:hypothetical protein